MHATKPPLPVSVGGNFGIAAVGVVAFLLLFPTPHRLQLFGRGRRDNEMEKCGQLLAKQGSRGQNVTTGADSKGKLEGTSSGGLVDGGSPAERMSPLCGLAPVFSPAVLSVGPISVGHERAHDGGGVAISLGNSAP